MQPESNPLKTTRFREELRSECSIYAASEQRARADRVPRGSPIGGSGIIPFSRSRVRVLARDAGGKLCIAPLHINIATIPSVNEHRWQIHAGFRFVRSRNYEVYRPVPDGRETRSPHVGRAFDRSKPRRTRSQVGRLTPQTQKTRKYYSLPSITRHLNAREKKSSTSQ